MIARPAVQQVPECAEPNLAMPRPVETVEGAKLGQIDLQKLTESGAPVLLKNAASDWPIVAASRSGNQQVADYLGRFYNGAPVVLYRAPATSGGVFFYNDSLTGFNFRTAQVDLRELLVELLAANDADETDALYVGSTDLEYFFPKLSIDNPVGLHKANERHRDAMGSIWIGNRTTAKAHFDMSNNIACCVVGRRRFTLFPPDQIANLYPGPLEPTPGGQVVSMVDFKKPDYQRHPRFADAMGAAMVAEMEPGDVLVYPAMWWHHVEALDRFNILINYWWNAVPAHLDTPMNSLLHGILSLRDRPEQEKSAWRALFDFYLFGDPDLPRQHLPEHALGDLATMSDPLAARRLRAKLINRLNR